MSAESSGDNGTMGWLDQTNSALLEEESGDWCHLPLDGLLEGYALCQGVFCGNSFQDFVYLKVNRPFEDLTGLRNVTGKRVSEVLPGFQDTNRELLTCTGASL